jgi:peptidoglycan/LPS O-acetylase OafA/YrhL
VRTSPFKLTYRPALDGLRGVAIIGVFAHHAQVPFLAGGFIGVDIFFVLSGFLITALLLQEAAETRRISLRSFYIRRALRLLPALAVLLGALLLVPRAFGMTRADAAVVSTVSALYASNWVRAFDVLDLEVLSHTWSLSIEEQFYLLWPPLVAVSVGLGLRRRWLVLVALAGIAEATIARSALWTTDESWRRLYNGLDTRIDTLLVGALAALVLASLPSLDVLRGRAFRAIVLVAALVLVGAMHAGRIGASAMYFGIGTLVALCAALVVIGTVTADRGISSLLAFGPLVWIGRISYGLYLWHYPVVVGLFDSHRLARLGINPAWWIPMQIGASLALATASFYLLERPILRLKARFGSRVAGHPESPSARPLDYRPVPLEAIGARAGSVSD